MTQGQIERIIKRVEAADQDTIKEVILDDDANLSETEADFVIYAAEDICALVEDLRKAQKEIEGLEIGIEVWKEAFSTLMNPFIDPKTGRTF